MEVLCDRREKSVDFPCNLHCDLIRMVRRLLRVFTKFLCRKVSLRWYIMIVLIFNIS